MLKNLITIGLVIYKDIPGSNICTQKCLKLIPVEFHSSAKTTKDLDKSSPLFPPKTIILYSGIILHNLNNKILQEILVVMVVLANMQKLL